MSWLWLGLSDVKVDDAYACAALHAMDESSAGFLVAWNRALARPRGAVKVDARAIDPGGSPGWISLVLAPDEVSLPFDDPAVSGAIRRVLSIGPAAVCSTLSLGDDRFVGALTACLELDDRLQGDPFAHLFSARVLCVDTGILGHTPGLPGPVMQRYGGANPWPWDRFPADGA